MASSSEQGERGDAGIQGAAGERGPKGDHGQHGDKGERGERGRSWFNFNKAQLAAFLIVVVAAGFSVQRSTSASEKAGRVGKDAIEIIRKQNAETRERRDQICRSFELLYNQEVEDVTQRYRFISEQSPAERDSTLTRTLLRELPGQEKDARSHRDEVGVFVPPFCSNPGVGLSEPPAVVPERPKIVDDLLKG